MATSVALTEALWSWIGHGGHREHGDGSLVAVNRGLSIGLISVNSVLSVAKTDAGCPCLGGRL